MNTRPFLYALALAALATSACSDDSRTGQEAHDAEHADADHAASEGEEHAHADEHGDDHDPAQSVVLPAKIAEEVGIKTARIQAGIIRDEHEVQGLLTPVEGRHARIRARFPGIVRDVRVGVGDVVKAGQALATVESNSSLTEYAVTAPFAGTILDRAATAGDLAGDEPLFELADLSTLWVDLHLFGADAQHITAGLPVQVVRLSDEAVAATKLERVLPGTATASQSTIARALIRNHDGRWRPGTAVQALVTVDERPAERVSPLSAVQSLQGQTVVFVRSGETYTARAVKLGDRDAERAEILAGVELGEEIVVEQSYLIKADIEKAGAAHEH
jgi:cobalt-zinc-cadmium efflux system membrane fusion protein